MKDNILLVGLDYEFVKLVGQEIAISHNMHFLDTNDLIEYSLINSQNVKEVCGVEYFEREQKKTIFSMLEYENIVVNFPYSLILNEEYYSAFKKNVIIFIDLNKETLEKLNNLRNDDNNLIVEILAFEELKKALKNKAHCVVSVNNEDIKNCVKNINNLNIFNK